MTLSIAGNLFAFLQVVRAGEGTSDPRGYHRLFGGEEFESLIDHPRTRVTRTIRGGKELTSTAAGAYQALERTWDDFVRQVGVRDFSPASQDEFAVWCIRRRRALEDVEAGRFEIAVEKCALEWASLPGSPYGQPTISMARAREIYERNGGRYAVAEPAQQPVPPIVQPEAASIPPPDVPADPSGVDDTEGFVLRGLRSIFGGAEPAPEPSPVPFVQETRMEPITMAIMLANAAAQVVPALGRLWNGKDASEVAKRNVKAVEIVASAAKEALGAVNEQQALEKLRTDPEAPAKLEQGLQAVWFEITEAGGGGIEGARAANMKAAPAGTPLWSNPALVVTILLLPLVYGTVYAVLTGATDGGFSGELKAAIASAVVSGVLGAIIGFWLGSSFTTSRTRGVGATQAPQ